MRLLTKEFYTLAELQSAWEMADHDMQYLVAKGRLKLSIIVYSQILMTTPPGPHLPTDAKRHVYSGLLDLNASDALAIMRKGEAQIVCFSLPDGADRPPLSGPRCLLVHDCVRRHGWP